MKRYSSFILIGGIALIAISLMTMGSFVKDQEPHKTRAVALEATVYKTPTCGCCAVYAKYLEHEGVKVTVKDLPDLAAIKSQYGIPADLQSCHTSIINGYVVEGHMPLEVVDKLIIEKPDIKGIALPGMPSGSPGMPGPKVGTWKISALEKDGTVSEFMMY